MSFRRQADNFLKWREGGVIPVDAFFRVSGRALNARQNRLAGRRPGQYYRFDGELEYSDQQQKSEELRKTLPTPAEVQNPPIASARKWMFFWRPAAEPYSLGPVKIKNGDQREWLTVTLVEEEVLSDGENSSVPGYSENDFPVLVNLAMHSIWGPEPSDVVVAFHRKWKITHSERIA